MNDSATASAIRIYVGGVGESVREEDLRKIFGSLGTVGAVDIVRTKGRSFAYFDFVPSTHNSLNKLFSTYNGCAWKGGRLRLEKAKEHYLARLRQEWAENAELSTCSDAIDEGKDSATPIKPKKSLESEKHLQIFFPRLRKVKSLPFSGTGKHKYSFQRVEAPTLPKYFCDCEEHSDISKFLEVEKTQELDSECGGMDAKELAIMNSVMNKLFKREAGTITVPHTNEPVEGEKISSKGFGKLQMEENRIAVAEDDDDNLVINIVEGAGDGITGSYSSLSKIQKSRSSKKQSSRDGQAGNTVKIGKSVNGPVKEEKISSTGFGKLQKEENKIDVAEDDADNLVINIVEGAGDGITGSYNSLSKNQRSRSRSSKKQSSGDGQTGDTVKIDKSVDELVKEEKISSTGFGKPCTEENKIDVAEEEDDDDDNLIINIEGAGDGITGSYTSLSIIQKSRSSKRQSSRDGQTGNMVKIEKSDGVPSTKNSKSVSHGHDVGKESFSSGDLPIFSDASGKIQEQWGAGSDSCTQHKQIQAHPQWLQKSSWKELVDRNKSAFAVSSLLPGGISIDDEPWGSSDLSTPKSFDIKNQNAGEHDSGVPTTVESLEVERTIENQSTMQNESSAKTGRGSSWLHKSSWTQLVTNSKNKSFTISQIILGLDSSKHEFRDDDIAESKHHETIQDASSGLKGGIKSTANPTLTSQLAEQNSRQLICPQDGSNSGSDSVQKGNKAVVSMAEGRRVLSPSQSAVGVDEECLFMRSQASLRDWANSKAALSKSLKRKR